LEIPDLEKKKEREKSQKKGEMIQLAGREVAKVTRFKKDGSNEKRSGETSAKKGRHAGVGVLRRGGGRHR